VRRHALTPKSGYLPRKFPKSLISGIAGYLLIASLGVRLLGPVLIEYTAPWHNYASHLIFLTALWTIIGMGQWPLLRAVFPHAKRWVLASAGGGAAGALVDLALWTIGVDMFTSLLAGALAGGAYGLVTGREIARLEDTHC
jgi:hypothetical protein